MIHTRPMLRHRVSIDVRFLFAAAIVVGGNCASLPCWAASLVPLAGFGGDGWLAPGEDGYQFLGTGNLERGLAYGNGHLYLVSRFNPGSGGNNIRILNETTGADLGGLDSTGISGGTFGVNMVAVGGDGAIYVGNLQTTTNPGGGAFYKVYKWADEVSAPTVAYSGDAGITGARIGDDLAIIGSGSSTLLAAGFGNTPSVTGNNGYSTIDPTAGTATAVGFTGTPPNAGDFRLGITFTDSSHIIGTQGGTGIYRYTSFSGNAGTLLASPALTYPGGATAERLMAYAVIGGAPLLAVQSTGDSHVSVYSVADPTNPVFLTSGNATTGSLSSNGNATGSVAWGATTVNGDGSISRILYAMSSNQGIQAFTFTLPAPPIVSGDYNYDATVDAADYIVWRKTVGQPAILAGSGADGNGNGAVEDPADLNWWRARFGNTGSGAGLGSSAVPEPNTLAVAFLVTCGWLVAIRRR